MIIEKLKGQQNRSSTAKNYLCIWRQFNKFVMCLDTKPSTWEARLSLYIGYLIEKGFQSATIKSYISAVKRLLVDDGYKWNEDRMLFSSLTRACKLQNDKLWIRFPINCGLLELILFEVKRYFRLRNQPYLEMLYKALYALGYYGLLRVGELTDSRHVLKACNVHMARNKKKILLVLYSSKTHDKADIPQRIKITANTDEKTGNYRHRHFCPFSLLDQFLRVRGNYDSEQEPLFIFRDKSKVSGENARKILRELLITLNINHMYYDMHSLRIGRATDLFKYGYPVEEIKRMGRWKSNAVYKYIRS